MRDIALILIVFGSLPVIFLRPWVGILMWSWISFMNPHRLTWSFAYDFPFAAVVGGATILAWIFSREPKRFPVTAITVLLILFAIWVNITTVFAILPDEAAVKWDRVMKIWVMTFLALFLMGSRERIHLLVWVVAGSIAFYGIKGGAFTLLTGGGYTVFGPPRSFMGDNNAFALASIMILPLLRYLQLTATRRWLRWGLLAALLLVPVAVLGTYSRGAFLGLGAMLLVMWVKSRRRLAVALAGLVVAVVALSFMPGKWVERMESIQNYEQDASAMGRFDAWRFALSLAAKRPLGGGFLVNRDEELFMRLVPDAARARAFHSIYFEVLGEHGYVGLFLFLMLGMAGLVTAGQIVRRTRDRPDLSWARDLGAMCQVSLVGYAASGLFLNLAFFDLYYSVLAIIVLTQQVVKREIEAAEAPKDAPTAARSRPALSPAPVGASPARAAAAPGSE